MMPQTWNPTEVLQLCNDGRCVGYAPSKRRKCQMPVRRDNVNRYEALLIELAGKEPNVEIILPTLELLASYGLCVRFHQSQKKDMVHKWSGMIRAACPPPPRRSVIPSSVTTPQRSEIDALQEIIMSAQRRLDALRDASVTSSSSRSTSRPSASDISNPRSSRSVTVTSTTTPRRLITTSPVIRTPASSPRTTARHEPVTPTPSSRTATLRRPSTDPVTPPAVTAREVVSPPVSRRSVTPSRPATPPVTPPGTVVRERVTPPTPLSSSNVAERPHPTPITHCARTHVRRLPLDEECAVCYDDILLSECDSADVVWCRSGCGRSVHATCFETWRSEHSPSTPVKCVICRVPWAADCGCTQGCTTTHVRRRRVDGNCSICQEDLHPEHNERTEAPPLSWCKSGCGRSVHRECFETWRAECASNGRAATCTDCRAVWASGCEC